MRNVWPMQPKQDALKSANSFGQGHSLQRRFRSRHSVFPGCDPRRRRPDAPTGGSTLPAPKNALRTRFARLLVDRGLLPLPDLRSS